MKKLLALIPVLLVGLIQAQQTFLNPCAFNDAKCYEEMSKIYQKTWKKELSGNVYRLTSNKTEWFRFAEDGTLSGWINSTDSTDQTKDKEQLGYNMAGVWEISDYGYSTVNKGHIAIFSGKLQCNYSVSKKANLYWFEKQKANYSNICPSMLMEDPLFLLKTLPSD